MLLRNSLLAVCVASIVSLAATGVLAAESSETGGACTGNAEPQPAAPSASIELPDYASDSDDARSAAELAVEKEWTDYMRSVYDGLSRSSDPRDRAMASLNAVLISDAEQYRDTSYALTARARAAAPNDALVQWIALRMAAARQNAPDLESAARRLQHLEPDNGAVYIDELAAAQERKDETAISAILAKMSTATRFDVHFAELVRAQMQIFRRYPMPESALSLAEQQQLPREGFPFVMAMSATTAFDMPAFQALTSACRAPPQQSFARAADCAAIGRLMAARGDIVLVNHIGYAILRGSRTYTDDDMRAARNADWAEAKSMEYFAHAAQDKPTGPGMLEVEHDWFETGSELEAARRQLARRGIAATPPEEWEDAMSPFSAQCLARDPGTAQQSAPPSK